MSQLLRRYVEMQPQLAAIQRLASLGARSHAISAKLGADKLPPNTVSALLKKFLNMRGAQGRKPSAPATEFGRRFWEESAFYLYLHGIAAGASLNDADTEADAYEVYVYVIDGVMGTHGLSFEACMSLISALDQKIIQLANCTQCRQPAPIKFHDLRSKFVCKHCQSAATVSAAIKETGDEARRLVLPPPPAQDDEALSESPKLAELRSELAVIERLASLGARPQSISVKLGQQNIPPNVIASILRDHLGSRFIQGRPPSSAVGAYVNNMVDDCTFFLLLAEIAEPDETEAIEITEPDGDKARTYWEANTEADAFEVYFFCFKWAFQDALMPIEAGLSMVQHTKQRVLKFVECNSCGHPAVQRADAIRLNFYCPACRADRSKN